MKKLLLMLFIVNCCYADYRVEIIYSIDERIAQESGYYPLFNKKLSILNDHVFFLNPLSDELKKNKFNRVIHYSYEFSDDLLEKELYLFTDPISISGVELNGSVLPDDSSARSLESTMKVTINKYNMADLRSIIRTPSSGKFKQYYRRKKFRFEFGKVMLLELDGITGYFMIQQINNDAKEVDDSPLSPQ